MAQIPGNFGDEGDTGFAALVPGVSICCVFCICQQRNQWITTYQEAARYSGKRWVYSATG